MMTILTGLLHAIKIPTHPNTSYLIASDSLSAVKALENNSVQRPDTSYFILDQINKPKNI